MILRVLLAIVVILLCVLVVIPFAMNVTGFRFSQIRSLGSGESAVRKAGVLIRSTDNGKEWAEVTVSEKPGVRFPNTILDFSFHSKNADLLYLGTKGGGLWVSETGGAAWHPLEENNGVLQQNADVYKIAVSKTHPDILYIAAFQENRGLVLKSQDGGKSFVKIYASPEDGIGVFDIFVDPASPDHLFIVTGQGGLLETGNGGKTWRAQQWFSAPLVQFYIDPRLPSEMYVRTAAGKLFRSADSGDQWNEVLVRESVAAVAGQIAPLKIESPFAFFSKGRTAVIAFDSHRPSTLYAGVSEGLLRSSDGGSTWRRMELLIPPKELPIDAFAIHPENPRTIFVTASNQLYRSDDGGMRWNVNTFPTKDRMRMLVVHPARPEIMFAVLGR